MFKRREHIRTNYYGTVSWVREHLVSRVTGIKRNWDYESVTNPNASCPVCGASVFYYQNNYGSRVFFDELGPDWPKHPCTDNGKYKYSPQKRKTENRKTYAWELNGWTPLFQIAQQDCIENNKSKWILLKVEMGELKKQAFFWLDGKGVELEDVSSPIFMREEEGQIVFSWWEIKRQAIAGIGRTYRRIKDDSDYEEVKILDRNYRKGRRRMFWMIEYLDGARQTVLIQDSEHSHKIPTKSYIKHLDDEWAVMLLKFRKASAYIMVNKVSKKQ